MKVRILIDDPAPASARRFVSGDLATVTHRQINLTEKHPRHFEVKLDSFPTIGKGENERGLSRNFQFHKSEVQIIEE